MSAGPSKVVGVEQQINDQDHQDAIGLIEPPGGRWSLFDRSRSSHFSIPLRNRPAEHGKHSPVTILRRQALAVLFGLPAAHISDWDGLLVFFCHLESCFQELLDPRFEIIWRLLGRDISSAPIDVWHWCFAVIDAYKSARHQDASIEAIHQQMCQAANGKSSGRNGLESMTDEERKHAFQAIFAILCWTSATLKPVLSEKATWPSESASDTDALDEEAGTSLESTVLLAENCSHTYWSSDLRRPTSKMFHSYRLRADGTDHRELEVPAVASQGHAAQALGYNFEDMLYESSLNYASLSTIGRIRIKWVDTLTAHLSLDRVTREMSVYRHPSFCVAKILSKHKVKVLESIAEKLLPAQHFVQGSKEPDFIYREMLLSYRLIFGQSKKSRKIMSHVFRRLASDSGTGTAGSVDGDPKTDQFLEVLCTSPLQPGWRFLGWNFGSQPQVSFQQNIFPISALSVHNILIESDTYSARDDFPVFGQRLLALQRYNMRRQPSKMTDLWRDRRNSLQWYTLWAVLLIGSAGIILAVLQLVASVIQAAYTIHSASE